MSLQSEMEEVLWSSGRYEPTASAFRSSALKRASNDTHREQTPSCPARTGTASMTSWAVPLLAAACLSGYLVGRVPAGGYCVAGEPQSAGRAGEAYAEYAGQGSQMLSQTLPPLW